MSFWRKRRLDYSQITKNLFVGRMPTKNDADTLSKKGITLIINMRAGRKLHKIYSPKTITPAWVRTWDSRLMPIYPSKLVPCVKLSLEVIHSGGKVYVDCRVGRHRSAVAAAAILIAQGNKVDDVLQLLKEKRTIIDTDKAHINKAIQRFADYWNKK